MTKRAKLIVRPAGKRIIPEPADDWSEEFLKALGSWDEPIERPRQLPISKAKDPFR